MKKSTIRKRKLHEECYNMDMSFMKWLRDRLPIFYNDAKRIIDLNYVKIVFREHEYTQEELIQLLIRRVN